MNVYDSQRMADTLAPEGYVETATPNDADLVILNTCHIREKAAEKVYSELGRLRAHQGGRGRRRPPDDGGGRGLRGPGRRRGDRAPRAGRRHRGRTAELSSPAGSAGARRCAATAVVDTEFPPRTSSTSLNAPAREAIRARGVSAFVTVQEGCDKFCTFCVVPYTRGAEISRPVASIVAEAKRLADAGVREITLIGQNVNAYHGEGADGRAWTLGRLLASPRRGSGHRAAALHHQPSLRHGRQPDRGPSRPAGVDAAPASAGAVGLRPHPRRHEPAAHRARLSAIRSTRLRAARPDIALTSDFIVGFPGETETDFDATLALVEEVGFSGAYSFKYSPRPGTPAAEMAGQVAEEVKIRPSARACRPRSTAIAGHSTQAASGSTFECCSRRRAAILARFAGRSPYLQPVQVEAPDMLIGDIAEVTISDVGSQQPVRRAGAIDRARAEPALAGS